MSGDGLDKSASFLQPDSNQLKGALAFGVNLSQPQLLAQKSRLNGEHIFQVGENVPPGITANSEDPIGSISLPPGWSKVVPGSPPPGTYVFQVTPPGTYSFRVTEGQSFVPPDHVLNPSVQIHIGHGLDPVQPQAEAALRQVLQSKPATYGEQQLTADEFKSVAGIIGAQDGGNNQFNDLGVHRPKFSVSSASTVNIHGRTALLVKGNFLNGHGGAPGLARETIVFDNNQASTGSAHLQQIYLTAPPEKIQQYEKPFWDSLNSNRTYEFTVPANLLPT